MFNRNSKNKLHPKEARYLRKKDKEYRESVARGLTGPQPNGTFRIERIETNTHAFVAGLLMLSVASSLMAPSAEAVRVRNAQSPALLHQTTQTMEHYYLTIPTRQQHYDPFMM